MYILSLSSRGRVKSSGFVGGACLSGMEWRPAPEPRGVVVVVGMSLSVSSWWEEA